MLRLNQQVKIFKPYELCHQVQKHFNVHVFCEHRFQHHGLPTSITNLHVYFYVPYQIWCQVCFRSRDKTRGRREGMYGGINPTILLGQWGKYFTLPRVILFMASAIHAVIPHATVHTYTRYLGKK